jgi:hypothetical protein
MKLFNEMLGGEHIPIQSVTAIYNPNLTSTFVNAWNIHNERIIGAPSLFNSKVIKTFAEERAWVLSEYDRKVNYYDWNRWLNLPIIPCMFVLIFRCLNLNLFVSVTCNTGSRHSLFVCLELFLYLDYLSFSDYSSSDLLRLPWNRPIHW